MRRRSALRIQLVDMNGKSLQLSNIVLDVVLLCAGNKRYSFDIGVTDQRGICTTSYRALERQRRTNQQLFLMDYNTKLEECDDVVVLHVPTENEMVDRVASARRLSFWRGLKLGWRARVANNKRIRAEDMRVELGRTATRVSLKCQLIAG